MTDRQFSPKELRTMFEAALAQGDAKGVDATVRLMALHDAEQAQLMLDTARIFTTIATTDHITAGVKDDRVSVDCSRCQTGMETGASFGPIPWTLMVGAWLDQHTGTDRKACKPPKVRA